MSDVAPDSEPTGFVEEVKDFVGDVAQEAEYLVEKVAAEIPTAEAVVADVEKVLPIVEAVAPQTKPLLTEAEHFVTLLESLAETFRQNAVAVEKVLGEFITKSGFKR